VPVKVGLSYALFSGIGDNITTNKENETVDVSAFIVSAAANPTFGPATVSIAGFYSVNGNALKEVKGWNGGNGGTVGTVLNFANKKPGNIYDITAFGAAAEVKFKASDTITAALGGGYQQISYDKAQITWEDAANFGIYANATFKLGGIFSITPEIDYLNLESFRTGDIADKKADKLSEIIVGAQLRLDI
jgi:hypothetical protein